MRSEHIKYPKVEDIDLSDWCTKLECSSEELLFCISRVGTSWICVEAFWSMNQDRIRASFNRSFVLASS